MSEPPHQVEYDFDYWMNTDLMDACFDPLHDDMGLNSAPQLHSFEPNGDQRTTTTTSPSFDKFDISPNTSGHHSTGLEFSLASSLDEDPHVENNFESASIDMIWDAGAAETQNNSEYACQTSGTSFRGDMGSFPGCGQNFVSYEDKEAHERPPHTSGHTRTVTATPFDCVECGESLSSQANLLRHAKEKQHQPYSCECGTAFSRLDILSRHLESVSTEMPKYPCRLCKRHRGDNGFRRLDHLRQHERNYHHLETNDDSAKALASRPGLKYSFPVCPHPDCSYYRDDSFKTLPRSTQKVSKPFPTQGAFTKHMRDEHNECTFPCDIQGCDRVGRRGYFREKDLIKHRKQSHPDAPSYQPSQRELKYQCVRPGCNLLFEPSSISCHECFCKGDRDVAQTHKRSQPTRLLDF